MEGELFKEDLNAVDNHNGVVSHPEIAILECEIKWALGSTAVSKASGCNGIPVAIQNPRRWCCQSVALNMSTNLEDPAVDTGLEKVNPHPNSQDEQY